MNSVSGIYLGHFKNGVRDGIGGLTYENKVSYIGEWKNGKPCGQGI